VDFCNELSLIKPRNLQSHNLRGGRRATQKQIAKLFSRLSAGGQPGRQDIARESGFANERFLSRRGARRRGEARKATSMKRQSARPSGAVIERNQVIARYQEKRSYVRCRAFYWSICYFVGTRVPKRELQTAQNR